MAPVKDTQRTCDWENLPPDDSSIRDRLAVFENFAFFYFTFVTGLLSCDIATFRDISASLHMVLSLLTFCLFRVRPVLIVLFIVSATASTLLLQGCVGLDCGLVGKTRVKLNDGIARRFGPSRGIKVRTLFSAGLCLVSSLLLAADLCSTFGSLMIGKCDGFQIGPRPKAGLIFSKCKD